jgi:branched-chain amino acid transport system ATP-binding protein
VSTLLRVEDVHVSYGSIAALRGVTVSVEQSELVAIIGANGAGKSTLLRTIAGLNTPRQGRVLMKDASIVALPPEWLVGEGITLVPEGRHIFGSLTVEENIRLGAVTRTDGRLAVKADLDKMLALFPILRERLRQRAGQLSGGEQQMLAIARALMAAPKLLLLDEPSLGLAPIVVKTLYEIIAGLRASGLTVLLVEQNVQLALSIADRLYVMDTGRIAFCGRPEELRAMPNLHEAYFGSAA